MFDEEKEEDYWLDLAEDMGEELGVDTREGSVFMDMAAGHCIRIAKFYNDLDSIVGMLADDTAEGDILTEKAARDNVERVAAVPSYWEGVFEGVVPEEGTRFLCGEYYFTWMNANGLFCLVSELAGADANLLEPGSELVPVDSVDGLERAVLGKLIEPGKAEESDDALRARWREEKRNPSRNGNMSHYKMWCEEVPGVGKARIFPLWGGNLTVMAVLLSEDGKGVDDSVVHAVQDYVDPIGKGYPVDVDGTTYLFGDGLGEGAANLGAHFLARPAAPVAVSVSADVVLMDGYAMDTVREAASEKISTYLSRLALQSKDLDTIIVRISTIGSIIAGTDGVLDYDYDSLLLNGAAENILVDALSAAFLSEVVFDAGA